jgi:hypothetical protein
MIYINLRSCIGEVYKRIIHSIHSIDKYI